MESPDLAKIGMEPLTKFDQRQRSIIAGTVNGEFFGLIQRMLEDQLKLFNQRLINTENSNAAEVVSNHAMAKASGMVYTGLLQRISEEIALSANEASTIGSISDPERPYYPSEFSGQESF